MYYAAKRKRQNAVQQTSTTTASTSSSQISQTSVKKEKKLYNDGFDDEHGNYIVQIGEELDSRYIVQENLGKGSFGIVVQAHDTHRNERVAVKIIKNKPQFYEQAKIEINILTTLNIKDRDDKYNIGK